MSRTLSRQHHKPSTPLTHMLPLPKTCILHHIIPNTHTQVPHYLPLFSTLLVEHVSVSLVVIGKISMFYYPHQSRKSAPLLSISLLSERPSFFCIIDKSVRSWESCSFSCFSAAVSAATCFEVLSVQLGSAWQQVLCQSIVKDLIVST